MSLASFVASQRANHGVPHAVSCRALAVSESWFYKWHDRPPSPARQRRERLDAEVKRIFERSGGTPRTYGSPRVHAELRDLGWVVSKKTVAASMARQALVARPKRRFRCLTRQDKRKVPFADLFGRDFAASAPNIKWCGDMTEIPTAMGKLYLLVNMEWPAPGLPGAWISHHRQPEPHAERKPANVQYGAARPHSSRDGRPQGLDLGGDPGPRG